VGKRFCFRNTQQEHREREREREKGAGLCLRVSGFGFVGFFAAM